MQTNSTKNIPGSIIRLQSSGPIQENDTPTDELGLYFAFSAIVTDLMVNHLDLIYIGKSDDGSDNRGIRGRINDHIRDDHANWRKSYNIPKEAEIVYYTIPISDRDLITSLEAACVYFYGPRHNSDFKDAIPSHLRLYSFIRIDGQFPLKNNIIDPDLLTYSE